jgi:hypothetical protein
MGLVYLIRAGDRYKIGKTSRDIKNRVKELDTSNHEDLHVVCKFETLHESLIEKTLHRKFFLQNVKNEWFDMKDEDVKNFIEICKGIEENIICLKNSGNPFI